MFIFPHGATVDREGNLWVTDSQVRDGKGHQVFKFRSEERRVGKECTSWCRLTERSTRSGEALSLRAKRSNLSDDDSEQET